VRTLSFAPMGTVERYGQSRFLPRRIRATSALLDLGTVLRRQFFTNLLCTL
jgi:hypothetical protein